MADPNVITEFLVGVGFAVDEAALSRFRGVMTTVTHAFNSLKSFALGALNAIRHGFKLFLEMAAGTGGLIYAIDRVTKGMMDLFWASERVGTSVQNLIAAGVAGRQAGLAFDAVQQQVRQLNLALRVT